MKKFGWFKFGECLVIRQIHQTFPPPNFPAIRYNDNLPTTACKVYDLIESKYVFNGRHNQRVNFTIATNHSTIMCELFLTAQPELYAYYDTFYVQLLLCPLGSAQQNDFCDCDPQLNSYTEKCMSNYKAVKQFPNC